MDQKIKAFLDMIAFAEGTSTSPSTKNDGYDVIVSGVDGPEVFDNYSDHPFAFGRPAKLVDPKSRPPLYSTASGRYQLLLKWWRAYKTMLNLSDFSPASQDSVAIRQLNERGALTLIEQGKIQEAISACSIIWASLPGNDYGQAGNKTMEALLENYQQGVAV